MKTLKKICGITVEFVNHALAHDFLPGIELKHKAVEDGVFAALQFRRSGWVVAHVVNFLIQALDCLDGSAALGADAEARQSPMVKVRAHISANGISQSRLGAQVREQARGKAAAKYLVQHLNGVIIRVVAANAR